MNENLAALLYALADERGPAPAIMDRRGRTLSFAGLAREARRVATVLAEGGVRAGDRALVLVPMSTDLYVTLAALWTIGAVPTVVDPSAGRAYVRRCLQRAAPRALIGIPKAHLLRLLVPEVRAVPLRFRVGGVVPGAADLRARPRGPLVTPAVLPGEHPALVTFTSGSTGQPKVAVRTHTFLREQHRVLARHLDLRAGRTDLVTLQVVALMSLASGAAILLPDSALGRPARLDARAVLRQLARTPARMVAGSPALLDTLARAALARAAPLPFERVYVGGGPVFPRTLEALQRAAPLAQLVSVYGSTEVEPIAHQAWADVTAEDLARTQAGGGLLAGRPVPELRVALLPPQDGPFGYASEAALLAATCAPGEVGEIVVSGAHVLPGYLYGEGDADTKWRDPATGRVWHRTGDAGTLDGADRLWLLGRVGARVTDARGTLYPFAVEAAAMTHPRVRRAALLGAEGRRVLCVEWDGAPDAHLPSALAWAQLDEVRAVAQIPVDARHNAKVDYAQLRVTATR
ncbi:AMP-binding protein [Deinococcus maricopensis]|uniref:AMP-dependent synthetase and ligase n=1 Tax=Deinococcus maricopensis (strain DSM 21211 / LMG 22137 / NRRL B-23946 / LB-34) TaxID=709986 RepID=E8U6X5_DEIML|nr:AMP-binding protein [Deinococcus maricopensis]ADV66814.1 AMP-dependent synthetase and ligase [Deinococcus maricopensis DSM 21211]